MRFLIFAAVLLLGSYTSMATTIYQSNFESDNGGWTSSGFASWEWGSIAFTDGGCDTPGTVGPAGANSGQNVWGTVLNTCYVNSGATSSLSQTFDLTGYTSASFSWFEWRHIFLSFDTGILFANDTPVYAVPDAIAVDWTQRTVDLTPYAGGLVTLRFDLGATTVVNRPGWYLDDMILTASGGSAIPEPSTWFLLATGGLILLARRRFSRVEGR